MIKLAQVPLLQDAVDIVHVRLRIAVQVFIH
jgi:hypothetical protein